MTWVFFFKLSYLTSENILAHLICGTRFQIFAGASRSANPRNHGLPNGNELRSKQ